MKTIKKNLVTSITNETGLIEKDVHTIIQKTLDYIVEALEKGDTVEFRNFGVFEICERKQRIGRNPNKPEDTVVIPARKAVRFRAGKLMRERILKK